MAINLELKTNQNLLCSFPVKNSTPLQGELKFSWGKFIELDYTASCFPELDFDEDHLLEVTVNNLEKVTLQGFDHHHEVFKAALTGCLNTKRILKASFYTSDLSGLFSFDISNSKYLDDNGFIRLKFEPIQASFLSEFGYVNLSMNLAYSSKHDLGKICFDYKIVINLEFDDFVSIDNIEKVMFQLKQLFSTITAHNFSFEEISIYDDKGKSGSLYFATNDEDYEPLTRHQYILDTRSLRSSLDTLLKHFFGSCSFEFKNIWSRVPPLLQLKHLLEYEVLIYGSILDKYVKHQCKELIQPEWTFRTTYKEFINKNKLKEWISPFFSSDDFDKVLKIRDRAAHGEIEELSNEVVIDALAKLKTLIFFLMYRDLSFSEQDILSFFWGNGHSHFHPIIRECKYDHHKCNRQLPLCSKVKEIQVKKGQDLNLLKEIISTGKVRELIFLKDKSKSGYDEYVFLPQLSERFNEYFFKERHYWKHIRDLKDMVWLILPETLKRDNNVSYVSNLYVRIEKHQKPVLIRECFIIEKKIHD